MKFEQYGIEKENLKIETEPQEFIEHNLLKDLHNLLGFIKKTKPDILKDFIEIFSGKLTSQLKKGSSVNNTTRFLELIKQYANLVEYQDLTKLSLSFFFEKFGISENQFWENKSELFPAKNFHSSANGFYFNQLTTLIDILGKDNAISFYKNHLLKFINTYDTNQKNIYNSLDELRERHIRFISKGTLGRIRLFSNVENGRLIKICKNCEKIEHLDETIRKEKDLLYTIACWVHIPLAEMWNDNFVLTLNDCIAKGDSFCTYVYHDKRINKELKYPTKSFLDNMVQSIS